MAGGPDQTVAAGSAAEPVSRSGRHPKRFAVMAVVCIALLMASVDQTIVATALKSIQGEMHAPLNWSSWTITVYSLAQILVMPIAGNLSDQYGRKTIFLAAVALFTGASLACGMANDIYMLVTLRGVQAVGGGAFIPSATGIVSDVFGPDRDRATALFTSVFPMGGITGPVLGGVIVANWSWRWIFFINVPLGVLLLILARLIIPNSGPRAVRRVDVAGIALLLCALLPAMFAISVLGSRSAAWWSAVVPASIAATAIGIFIRHSQRESDSVIPIRYLRGNGFGVIHLVNFVSGAAILGFGALIPIYAQTRYAMSPLSAGTLLTARAVGMIAVAGAVAFLLRRTGYRKPMAFGFAVLAVGMTLTAVPPPAGPSSYLWLSCASAVAGVGMGISIPASNNAALHLLPEGAASISGLRGMFRQAGGITGVSITTAIGAHNARPAIVQAEAFVVLAGVLFLLIPLIRRVPEHFGPWS